MSTRGPVFRPFMEDLESTSAHILQFTAGLTEADFQSNLMLQWSVIRGLEMLGEASKQLSDILTDAATRFPAIPFKAMYETRNRVIHGYHSVDLPLIWNIVQNHIPALHRAAQDALANWPTDLA